jgi:hypothetical protein
VILGLDLSTACTGWSKFDEMGRLIDYGRIVPDAKSHPYQKIKFVVEKLQGHMLEANKLAVEGIFLNTFFGAKGQVQHNVTGFELLARLSGAVINSYLQNHDALPTLYKAVEARKLVGVKGSSQKAEVQVWAIRNFGVGHYFTESEVEGADRIEGKMTPEILEEYDGMIDAYYAQYTLKEISKNVFKSRMDEISHLIESETGIGEDVADAILLGLAYVKGKGINENTTDIEQPVS